jgi:hypothetical protein
MGFEFRTVTASPGTALEPRPAYSPAPYSGGFSFAPSPAEQPAVKQAAAPGVAFRRVDLVAPLALTTPLLVLGRVWHAHGAAGSLGYAVLFGGLSAAAALVGCLAERHARIQGTALSLAGGLASMAVAGYAVSGWPSVILWALSTASGYALSWMGWRAAHQRRQDQAHEKDIKAMECSTALQIATVQAQAAIRVEELRADAAVKVAERRGAAEASFAARYGLSVSAGAAVADEGRFALSPTARAALGMKTDDVDVLDVLDVSEGEFA